MQTAVASTSSSRTISSAQPKCKPHTCAIARLHSHLPASRPSYLTGARHSHVLPASCCCYKCDQLLHPGVPIMTKTPRSVQAAASRGAMPVQANLFGRFGRVVRAYTFFYSDSAGEPSDAGLAPYMCPQVPPGLGTPSSMQHTAQAALLVHGLLADARSCTYHASAGVDCLSWLLRSPRAGESPEAAGPGCHGHAG